jgi:hypothetical protein
MFKSLKTNALRKRIKKTSGHMWFYHEKSHAFDYFYKFTSDYDLTIMSFDTVNKTYREFILDEVIIRAMFEAVDGAEISRDKKYISDKMVTPNVAKEYLDAGFTMLKKTGNSKFANVVVLAKVGEFGLEKERGKALILRRVVYNSMLTIGVDTIALPLNAVKEFIKKMEKHFKTEREIVEKGNKKK